MSSKSLPQKTVDTLASLIGGLGDLSRDKAAGVYYAPRYYTDAELTIAYQTSWLTQKITDIPADDAFRNGIDWQAEKDQIAAIEETMNRLGVMGKLKTACIRGRLFGGAAVVIGTGDGDLSKPLDPKTIGKDGLRYLTVVSKKDLTASELVRDVTSPYYMTPEFYTVAQTAVKIHTSRLVKFYGQHHPEPEYATPWSFGWSDSVLISKFDAIKAADAIVANINSLVFEASVDVFGVPDLLDQLTDPLYEARMISRFGLAAANKSINRSIIRDAAETYDRKQISFGGLDALIDKFVQWCSGAADIPATRLLGMSPAGMSSTGESDLRNYYDAVSADQKNEYTPQMSALVECLIISSLGTRDADIWYQWSPLWQLTATERSVIGKTNAETANILVTANLVQPEALAKAVVNRMTEDGVFPGLEQDVADLPPIDFEAEAEADRQAQEAAAAAKAAGPDQMTDARPLTLYISRKVMNAAAITKHFTDQGLPVVDDLHVTVAYSRVALDWMKVGESWQSELKIAAGGPRLMEHFNSVLVLEFTSSELKWRNRNVVEAGGSHDYEEYRPHITIAKIMPGSVDLDELEPWQGEILLGPEIFERIRQ